MKDESHVIHVDLGSCVSIVLCGKDEASKIWFGVNHLFKSRVHNSDVALEHVAALYDRMVEKGISRLCCLGLFGAAYREKSMARQVAQLNVLGLIEALSLYNLEIEIFQTGYSQGISICKSDERESILIRHNDLGNRTTRLIELPLIQLFR